MDIHFGSQDALWKDDVSGWTRKIGGRPGASSRLVKHQGPTRPFYILLVLTFYMNNNHQIDGNGYLLSTYYVTSPVVESLYHLI